MDLRRKIHQFTPGKMINMLGAQDVLEMEVEHKPPLDYSLKPKGPSDSEAGLCVVFCERSQKEYVVMSSAPASHSCLSVGPGPTTRSRSWDSNFTRSIHLDNSLPCAISTKHAESQV